MEVIPETQTQEVIPETQTDQVDLCETTSIASDDVVFVKEVSAGAGQDELSSSPLCLVQLQQHADLASRRQLALEGLEIDEEATARRAAALAASGKAPEAAAQVKPEAVPDREPTEADILQLQEELDAQPKLLEQLVAGCSTSSPWQRWRRRVYDAWQHQQHEELLRLQQQQLIRQQQRSQQDLELEQQHSDDSGAFGAGCDAGAGQQGGATSSAHSNGQAGAAVGVAAAPAAPAAAGAADDAVAGAGLAASTAAAAAHPRWVAWALIIS